MPHVLGLLEIPLAQVVFQPTHQFSKELDSSFPPFAISIFALLWRYCSSWFSDLIGFSLLPTSMMMHFATFHPSILFSKLSLILPCPIFEDQSVGSSSCPRKDWLGHPLAPSLRYGVSLQPMLCCPLETMVVCRPGLHFCKYQESLS